MDGNRNLLPWILSGLSIATAAIAITVGSIKTSGIIERTGSTALETQAAPLASTAQVQSTPAIATAEPAPAPAGAIEAQLPPQEIAAAQEAPSNQIWACTTNGVKTYSNNPCGEKSALLDVGPVNTMEATRVPPSAHQYTPEQHYAPDYASQDAPEQPEEVYSSYGVGVGVVPHYVRKRPIHVYPMQHHRGPQPRNY
jgi:hypothetical protein